MFLSILRKLIQDLVRFFSRDAVDPSLLEQDTPYTFRVMPLQGQPGCSAQIESMRGKIASVGYNRDVVTTRNSSRPTEIKRDSEDEEAECFVVDTYGAIHTLKIHWRHIPINGMLLEDHAEELAKALGVEFVRF